MPGLASGRRDRRILLQMASVSIDPTTGQLLVSWPPDGGSEESLQAEWVPETAQETWRVRQIDATVEGLYKIPYVEPRPTPDAAQIIADDGRTYDIKGVTEIGRQRGLILSVAAKAEAP